MRILLVEDHEKLSSTICEALENAGFKPEPAFSAGEALAALDTSEFSLMVLDLGLPDEDGLGLLKKIRKDKNPVPVLILTARDTLDEKLEGLNSGADDYMTKPFEIKELVARIHTLMRRPAGVHYLNLELANISYDPQDRLTKVSGKTLKLSKKEVALLEIMLRSNGKTVPKEKLEMDLYSYGEEGSANSVEVLLHRLKKKLMDAGAEVDIHALRGIGYMMVGKDGQSQNK